MHEVRLTNAPMAALDDSCTPAFISTVIGWEFIVRKDQHERARRIGAAAPGNERVLVRRE